MCNDMQRQSSPIPCIDPYCAAHHHLMWTQLAAGQKYHKWLILGHLLDYVGMLNCVEQGRPGINAKNKTLSIQIEIC